ncbi:hypothetical protein [Natronolimnohabitans innermongolicus]|uniref:hypothetical protein n=1 Tax=Natronolimnohabitans innermongolicus TaxID=253107 RepID=UPI000677BC85|nr:hypothetical protein [Natronolimnohabitans innermongolicus]
MLVQLYQYKHEEVQFDDNRTTGESQTEDAVDQDPKSYFGVDVDELGAETWETVEYDDDPIQRRSVTVDGVTALSVLEAPDETDGENGEADDAGGTEYATLPGRPIQLRLDGGTERLEHAAVVDVQDHDPSS